MTDNRWMHITIKLEGSDAEKIKMLADEDGASYREVALNIMQESLKNVELKPPEPPTLDTL